MISEDNAKEQKQDLRGATTWQARTKGLCTQAGDGALIDAGPGRRRAPEGRAPADKKEAGGLQRGGGRRLRLLGFRKITAELGLDPDEFRFQGAQGFVGAI